MDELKQKIYDLVRQIPPGKVSTYGEIAKLSLVGSPRLVGRILHLNTDPETIPCHRVVYANGDFAKNYAYGGALEQKAKLSSEGVVFNHEGKVDLTTARFEFALVPNSA